MMNAETTTTTTKKSKLEDIELGDAVEGEDTAASKARHETQRTLFTRIIQGTAVAAIVINIAAMALQWSWIMFFAGLCGVGLGSGVIYYQNELREDDTLRTVQNELRHKVNEFAKENETLSVTASKLEGELIPLKETEKKFHALAEEQGVTVNKLSALVKTNKVTLVQMKNNQVADVLASMMTVVLQADRSGDGMCTDQEIQRMILRLKMLPTIEMNEDLFKAELETIQEGKRQISAIMKLMEQVAHDDVPDEKRVFKLSDKCKDW